ncbi:MAG: hypothetical protein LBB23_02800 [Rickettsiales bacterium]|jgi:alpha-beta hydrolase superfamily lysophospholipase|nr:hypothetical protein [Rickettsiales bacterium]
MIYHQQELFPNSIHHFIPVGDTEIYTRFTPAPLKLVDKAPIVFMATGMHSNMDSAGNTAVAEFLRSHGYATFQFNFMGCGEGDTRSKGHAEHDTITNGVLTTINAYEFMREKYASVVDTSRASFYGNSYGATLGTLAIGQGLISPEAAVFNSPLTWGQWKPYKSLIRFSVRIAPGALAVLGLPLYRPMTEDVIANYMDADNYMSKYLWKFGRTSAYFFTGAKDKKSNAKIISDWVGQINTRSNPRDVFVGDKQAHFRSFDIKGGHDGGTPEMLNKFNENMIDFFSSVREANNMLGKGGRYNLTINDKVRGMAVATR